MRILKPVLVILLFCLLGIALGVGAYYLQKHFSTSSVSTGATSATTNVKAVVSPTPSVSNHFTDSTTNFGIDIPTNILLESFTTKGYTTVDLSSFNLLRVKGATTALQSDTELFIMSSDTKTALTAAKSRLQRSILLYYPSETLQEVTASGDQVTHKEFTTTSGGAATSYELETDSLYILFYRNSSSSDEPISDNELEKIVKSIKLNSTPGVTATATPTASASSAYLLQSN